MKNGIITLLLFLFVINGFFYPKESFGQNPGYQYPGRLTPSVKKEKLNNARFINEIMPDYPQGYYIPEDYYIYPQDYYNKIIDYVEILATCGGKALTSESTSDTLTTEQKNILNTTDLGTDVGIKIKFKYKDGPNDNTGSVNRFKERKFVVTVVPETEAEYPGGYKQMRVYLKENVTNKISEAGAPEKIRQAIVKFTVDEEGQTVDVGIFKTSTDPKIDKLILDAINRMPRWRPAKNSSGIKVKQKFTIPFGNSGC